MDEFPNCPVCNNNHGAFSPHYIDTFSKAEREIINKTKKEFEKLQAENEALKKKLEIAVDALERTLKLCNYDPDRVSEEHLICGEAMYKIEQIGKVEK